MTTKEFAAEGMDVGNTVVSISGWDHLYTSNRLRRSAWSNQPVIGETIKLRELCKKADPGVIVELGGRYGGTTLALHDAAPETNLITVDRNFIDGDKITDFDEVSRLYGAGYDTEEYHTRRSWFPPFVEFLNMDFAVDYKKLQNLVDLKRVGNMFLFVDGDWGQKSLDMLHYLDWLRSGDVMALNNSYDVLAPDQKDNEWNLPDVEKVLLPRGFKRFEFEWCERVGMMLTRAWIKV